MSAGARAWEQLRQEAKATGRDVQALATSYAIERFMERLMRGDASGALSIKGGQSLGILLGNEMRPTKDLDIDVASEAVGGPIDEAALAAISSAARDGVDDGLAVDAAAITFERRAHQGEGGLRVTVPAAVHTCRATFVIDVGLGNEVSFEAPTVVWPGILGRRKSAPAALEARIYPVENTFAEKLVSKVEDGAASIRHKDFFDLWILVETARRVGDLALLHEPEEALSPGDAALAAEAKARLADGTMLSMPERGISRACVDRLGTALARTSAHRGAELPGDLPGFLMEEFGASRQQSAQWANWCRNNAGRLLYQPPGTHPGDDRTEALTVLVGSLAPDLSAIAESCAAASAQRTPDPRARP